jgi:sporulation protein YlmC with PRC-barrel domain
MKRTTAAITALSFVALLPAAAVAQTPGSGTGYGTGTERKAPAERGTTERMKRDRPAWSNTQGLHETGDVIGATVQGPDNKNIGKVDALLIDPKDGKISHAVVSMGGVLGVGDEKVVVPYSALTMSGHEGGRRAKITIDQSALDQAPKYVKSSERQPAASPATTPRATDPSRTDTRTDTKK